MVLAALVAAVAGCRDATTSPGGGDSSAAGPADAARSQVEGMPVPPDLARTFTRLLERRAQAVLTGDRRAFASVLGPDPSFRTAQLGYYDNLRQLPLGVLSYALDKGSLVRTGDSYWVVVDVAMQISGYDDAVVHAPDRFRFGRHGGGYRLTSVTDAAWEQANGVESQPWDLEPVTVHQGLGVLGVFDAGSARLASTVVGEVEDAVADVRGVVPYDDWDGDVVVYALSTSAFLDQLPQVPGGDPGTIDGLTFTLASSGHDAAPAATRVLLGPSVLTSPRLQRDRLIRHELAHVAMAAHDDHAPVWLAEGLAEYVSVQPLAPARRMVDRDALRAAEQGRLVRLPDDQHFNDRDVADVDYALSWWACEWVAQQYGASALWTLLDDLDQLDPSGRGDADVGRRIAELLGVTRSRLAKNAAALMVRTYRGEGATPTRRASPSTHRVDP